ncbi:MAG: amidohydrolase [Acidimicrobiia bacterium]|nr:amidohydrolase [Acidimicrobiia bacterium]
MVNKLIDDRYIVISADCHAGADLVEYRPFLDAQYHSEFDAWVESYEIPYEDLKGPDGSRNWDSDRRLTDLEADGIVAEVIFPNTVPPFYPKSSLTYQPPATDSADAERRWAGLRAHNRWLAEFCAQVPGRRAGICQINLYDIEASVREIRWAKSAGLTGGVLLPGVPPGVGLPELHEIDYYDPLWQVCEELGMPVNHHGGSGSPAMSDAVESPVIFLLEITWWSHRALTHLIVSGALENHPEMKCVFTEQGTEWIPSELMRLDYFFDRMRNAVGSQEYIWGEPVMAKLPLQPSEYWARQCYVGSSFIRPNEVPSRHEVGIDSIMWGSDYPHKEMSFPYSLQALRAAFSDCERSEVEQMLGLNAADVYGFDLKKLAPIAEKVGPKVSDVATVLLKGEIPKEAERCPAFVGLTADA